MTISLLSSKRLVLAAFVALQVLDVVTTMRFLENGRGVELNPIFIFLMELGGPWWWLAKLAVMLGIVAPVLALGRLRYVATMTAFYVFVVANNAII